MTHQFEKNAEDNKRIINHLYHGALRQREKIEKLLNSVSEMVQVSREVLQKASDQIEKLNRTGD